MTKINDHIDMLEVPLVAQTPVRVTLVNGSDFAVLNWKRLRAGC